MGRTHAFYKKTHAAAGGDGWADEYRAKCLEAKAKADAEQAAKDAEAAAKAKEEAEILGATQ